MYDGWLKLGGTEIINAERTEAYVAHQMPLLTLRGSRLVNEGLRLALDDNAYESPLIDDAPWVDRSDPATFGFFGLYPLELQGFSDSTLGRTVTQAIVDGGAVGSPRHSTKQLRVRGVLVAENELALEAGMTWLRAVLATEGCDDLDGADLCFFASFPEVRVGAVDLDKPLTSQFRYGPVSPETSPLTQRLPETDGPAKAEWFFEARDGIVLQWGARALVGDEILEQSRSITPQRTNYVRFGSFTESTEGWALSGGATLKRVTDGAGGAYAEIAEDTPPSVRHNWFSDPGMAGEPVDAGWTSNALYGVEFVAVDNAPTEGMIVARLEQNDEQSDLWAQMPLQGPAEAETITVSLWLSASSQPVTLSLLDANGQPVAVEELGVLTQPWQRVAITGSGVVGGALRISTLASQGAVLLIDAPLAESGENVGEFFTGDFADTPIVVNLLPNPSGSQNAGTVVTPYGTMPRVQGFLTTPGTLAWQTTEDAYGAAPDVTELGLGAGPLGSSPLGAGNFDVGGLGAAGLGETPLGGGFVAPVDGYSVAVEWEPAVAVTSPTRVTTPTTITTPSR